MQYVEMPLEDYLELLESRRDEIAERQWDIPDAAFEKLCEFIEDVGYCGTPSYVVDNLAINGDYGPISNYPQYKGYSEEELEDEGFIVYEDPDYDEKCILIAFGV